MLVHAVAKSGGKSNTSSRDWLLIFEFMGVGEFFRNCVIGLAAKKTQKASFT
ncbi:hypothetical protein [Limnohabitans sp.]|jgi:hypothetical protein|uniref:hypothetical protein n=1 Tax=Limnohabitans sp. TaxID=1907725 RepID=UPI0025F6CDFD|nr:hypothetical protein [Limnohabitans sp.]